VFNGSSAPIGDADRARMTCSWRPGCPVPIEDLRLVSVDHWGYDGLEHRGEVVVHAEYAEAFVGLFHVLFDARFPIERMQLVDVFEGDDHASTLANNTAAFNCRSVVGRPGSWSEHAFGRAIDVNPRVNPYVLDPRIQHPALAPYLDRSLAEPGMIRAGDAIIAAFVGIGWQWGGTWSSPDYQHFSATGR
jgi:poly-gamma-glutamate synthesis protein (capsule biosynthesis protein)